MITSATDPIIKAAAPRAQDKSFIRENCAEQNGHDRIDVGISGDLGRIAVAQQPDVGVADDAADEYKVNERA